MRILKICSFNLIMGLFFACIACAEVKINDPRHRFEIFIPCDPVEMAFNANDRVIHTRNCYDSKSIITLYVHTHSKADGRPIRYRKSDIDKAIESEIRGFLLPLGGPNIKIKINRFKEIKNTPALYYYATGFKDNFVADGVGFFENGIHYRIGTMHNETTREKSKSDLRKMLDTFKTY